MANAATRKKMRDRRTVAAASSIALILFILPTPLLVKAVLAIFSGKIFTLAWAAGLYLVFIFGATLAKTGLAHEAEYISRRVARASPVPYKTMSALVTGAATFVTAWVMARHGFGLSLAFGVGAMAGIFLLLGFDPMGTKGLEKGSGINRAKVVEALATARSKLTRIEVAAKNIGKREFKDRIASILGKAHEVLEEIEQDPRDLRRARKFLNVYLDGAVEVTERYAATWDKTQSAKLEDSFRDLLTDMEHVFKEQYDKLLQDDELDLDVQMDVLRTRLKREGVL